MSEAKHLTMREVNKIINSFLAHIAKHWDIYEKNLPKLARTLMFYNEFCYGIRYLPEGEGYKLDINPKYPLLDDLGKYFGSRLTEEIKEKVYCAWPVGSRYSWQGYEQMDKPNELRPEYSGFRTTREFPAQKQFLDGVRNHPRIKLGMKLARRQAVKDFENFILGLLPKDRSYRKPLYPVLAKIADGFASSVS